LLVALGAMTATGVMAQSRGGRSRTAPTAGSGEDDALPPNQPPPVSTIAPQRGIAGPRLEPGAVLCRTEEDLARRAEITRRISDGVNDAGDPMVGCTLITQQRGVDILARHGLGRVQVKVKPAGQIGWTDVYLP
jgi:hypothetical protein